MDNSSPIPENPNTDTVRLLFELALHEEKGLADRANWLDTKTGAVLGFVIISIAELLGFLFLASTEKVKAASHPYWLGALFFIGVLALLVGVFFGLRELFPMGFTYAAGTENLALLADKDDLEIRLRCLQEMRRASVVNRGIVDKKARFLKRTVIFVGVALGCYAGAVVILFLSLLSG